MATTAVFKRRRSGKRLLVQKPRGVLSPRVQRVGPEHFGIVAVDCAKARSKWMLCDFYGTMLVPPTHVSHGRGYFDVAILQLREAMARHRLQDLVVAIERTGNYHLPVKRAFAAAGFECRIVHPLATKHFRQPAHPGVKTDDIDLAAIYRATVNGFGLIEEPLDSLYARLRLLVRHRRDLVQKRSAVCCQLREHWEATLPGFAALFEDLWGTPAALAIARRFDAPEVIVQADEAGLRRTLEETRERFQSRSLERVLAWARTASSPDPQAAMHHRIATALDDDRLAKTREIQALEEEIAGLLVQTPYVLLLSFEGIHVVSAADLAGEMGPVHHYASARAITGRAGLFPARYQSDEVDLQGGLIRCANRSLRAALLRIADNLRKCNRHFRGRAAVWQAAGTDVRRIAVRIASRFSRIAYQMVAGRQVFHHPCLCGRDWILDKLLAFHHQHGTPPLEILADLQAAIAQLPHQEYSVEAVPLSERLQRSRRSRRRGPQPIGEVLPLVLAKLGVGAVQSNVIGARDSS
jgi:transposase